MFKKKVAERESLYTSNSQQDSFEFLIFLLNTLHEELTNDDENLSLNHEKLALLAFNDEEELQKTFEVS